jgi:tripartite-type tricarboxylate transporter receptor subunit TctC
LAARWRRAQRRSFRVSPALYRKLGYNAAADFAPIGLIGSTPNALAVHPSVPAATIAEFIALAKSRPGKLNYASAGLAKALALPDTHRRLTDQSVQPNPLTPGKYAAFIRAERAKWAKVVKDVGIPQK